MYKYSNKINVKIKKSRIILNNFKTILQLYYKFITFILNMRHVS